jgi:hypothetical protein
MLSNDVWVCVYSEVTVLITYKSWCIIYNISVICKFLYLYIHDVWYHLFYTLNAVHYYALFHVWCNVLCR